MFTIQITVLLPIYTMHLRVIKFGLSKSPDMIKQVGDFCTKIEISLGFITNKLALTRQDIQILDTVLPHD
ncbi:Uncharacterised protein [Vibrio cholerae]|uniref:Uncharacterized protein n=1 Tax=Vibrio cholerae TaxID=666 RepID=A0A656B0Y6_VIBCL|nr:Uncharacterised protein [Vibrio cholerae]CSA11380.1 Uncharacterised protein [Vibrio cholerae]CSA19649.1 Uncharacterised protein [Vibrio cholerae]CSA28185.1 Uncharacterised protein [Vibrio cholerae]CSA41862.1 Uncharacterised protein [Vibrio cholerae]